MAKRRQMRRREMLRQQRQEAQKIHVQPGDPCSRDTLRCPAGKSLRVDMPECCQQHLREIMDHISEVFEGLGAEWFMDYGTLLGSYRNPLLTEAHGGPLPPGIIPHDKDADIGMFGRDFLRLVQALGEQSTDGWEEIGKRPGGRLPRNRSAILGPGFQWLWKLPRRGLVDDHGIPLENEALPHRWRFSAGHSIKVRYSTQNHINCDIFPWYLHSEHASVPDDGRYHRLRYIGADMKKGQGVTVDRLLPLTTLEWEGREFPAPAQPEAMCRYRYGPDWATPIRGKEFLQGRGRLR